GPASVRVACTLHVASPPKTSRETPSAAGGRERAESPRDRERGNDRQPGHEKHDHAPDQRPQRGLGAVARHRRGHFSTIYWPPMSTSLSESQPGRLRAGIVAVQLPDVDDEAFAASVA